MKIGYHSDPRYVASISHFKGRIRRTFLFLEAFGLLLLFPDLIIRANTAISRTTYSSKEKAPVFNTT